MTSLSTPLRKQLAAAAQRARTVAETGARNALQALAVHEADPYRHMDDKQRLLRRQLRAQARQLGDTESTSRRGTFDLGALVEKLAYDQWHRLLFARFLLENNLLISPAHQVSVSLDDCVELAPSEGVKDAWAVAARYAAKALPEIFRADDPAGAVDLPLEDRAALVALVTGLPAEVFTASDSLGWCYQFWQAEKKDAVNASGTKIGADELPSVTQLFTEDYMVDFLLDNTLGAWHAGRVLAANPLMAMNATSEDELRHSAALPACPWRYLRFVKGGDGQWTPAAGTFDGWPKTAKELTCLDPCMGSGHFVAAMFERLVALRLAEEALDDAAAVSAVICDNLFGLEIDPRCTQIGAFNLALAAWRRVGYRQLPAMNLACSGLAPNTREADWLAIAGDDKKLKNGMARLYRLFEDAPVLGSLINPHAAEGDLLEAGFHELRPLLELALTQDTRDDGARELAVTARGLASAAETLARRFTLVATNVPYLGRPKQNDTLADYCDRVHPEARADLATCFVERCLSFCAPSGTTALATPQNWLFLEYYKAFRKRLLQTASWGFVARLGPGAFETVSGEVVKASLVCISQIPPADSEFLSLDVSSAQIPTLKAEELRSCPVTQSVQRDQLKNPDARITHLVSVNDSPLLVSAADAWQGLATGDLPRLGRQFWELNAVSNGWEFMQQSTAVTEPFGGRQSVLFWERGRGGIAEISQNPFRGKLAWGRPGVAVSVVGDLSATLYSGEIFSSNVSAITPKNPADLTALWAFCCSTSFLNEVRRLDQKMMVTNATLTKVPFDLARWQKVAADSYPHGLPKPFSSDPTQWLFNGHPVGADQPLHVAVARLLGYQWPRQTGSSFPDCPALGPDGLETLADDDGIVPISPIKGESAAGERLRELLARAYGKEWHSTVQERLLAQVGYQGASLQDWLRNGFFEQHCALFHHRPFIWHVWDGRKDGFSALVNYHKLTSANLEKLTFAYLGDWIRRQQAAVDAGEAGSDARLQAAKQLQAHLKRILDGEPPFDLFVRWKRLSQQAIGWNPDINDGVRMNIRPFMAQDIPGGKKGAGVLRAKPNIKWDKDRGNEPTRDKKAYPWFWGWDGQATDFAGGSAPDGNRGNACHYTIAFKQRARDVEAKK